MADIDYTKLDPKLDKIEEYAKQIREITDKLQHGKYRFNIGDETILRERLDLLQEKLDELLKYLKTGT